MAYKQYSSDEVIVLVNFKPIDFESVTVEPAEDKRSVQMGISGTGRHVKNLKSNGTVTIEVTDYSPSNTDLTTADKLDVPVMVSVIDKSSSGTAFSSEDCMLAKQPALKRSAEGSTIEWTFNYISGELVLTGARSY